MKAVAGSILIALFAAASARAASTPPTLQGLIAQEDRLVEDVRRADVAARAGVARAAAAFQVGAAPLADRFGALARAARGRERLLAQAEQALTLLRVNRSAEAASLYEQVALQAETLGDRATAFRAWIGAARALDDERRHQGAERDYQRAIEAAGSAPTPKQRSDIASYGAQFQARRGEYEAAMASAFEADRLAITPEDRYYAEAAISDIFFQLANSCGERLLIDSRSADPGDDGTGACRRAVTATKAWEARAKATAAAQGWTLMAVGATKRMDVAAGSPAWEGRLRIARLVAASPLYRPTDPARVGVTETFWTDLPSTVGDQSSALGQLLGQLRAAQDVLGPEPTPPRSASRPTRRS